MPDEESLRPVIERTFIAARAGQQRPRKQCVDDLDRIEAKGRLRSGQNAGRAGEGRGNVAA